MNLDEYNTRTISKTLGPVVLRHMSGTDQKQLERMMLDIKDDRNFVVQTLHHQLQTPKLDIEGVNTLQDDELKQLAKDYSRKEFEHSLDNISDEAVFPGFRQAVEEKIRNDRKAFIAMVDNMRFDLSDQYRKVADAMTFNSVERAIQEMTRQHQEQIESSLRAMTSLGVPRLSDIANSVSSSVLANFGVSSMMEEAAKGMTVSSQLNKAIEGLNVSSQLDKAMGMSSLASQLENAMSSVSGASRLLEQQNILSKQVLESISGQYNLTSKAMEALKPQIDIFQNWAGINTDALSSLTKFWENFEISYQIAEEKAVRVLKKYNWFVSPSLPAAFVREAVRIGNKKGNQRKAINKLFVDYFREDNYSNLLEMIEGWEADGLSKARVKKLKGCVSILRTKRTGMNPCDYVLPVVISQIDGIKSEYLKKKGLSTKKSFWVDSTGKQVDWKKEFKNHASGHCMDELAGDVLLEVLFQKAYPGMPLKRAITFNRHKILHGESLNYGRIDNTVRAFMLLDFLVSLL